jgi:hypothetical protein
MKEPEAIRLSADLGDPGRADGSRTFRLSRTIQPWNVVLVAQP